MSPELDPLRELRQLRDLTRARPRSVDSVRQRINQAVPTGSAVAGALVRIPTPGADAAARVKAAVIAANPRPASTTPWGPIAGAALALLLVGGGGAWWTLAGPAPGIGTQGGGTEAPSVVEHGGGVLAATEADVVRTREAVIHGVTEADRIERGVQGTTVTGGAAARTSCLGPFVTREPGRTVCSPVSAAGLLAVAESRREHGAAPEDVLSWLSRAATLHDDATVMAEVQAATVVTLHEAGQVDAALELASAYQQGGRTERGDEVARVGAAIALGREDCPTAVPFLKQLAPTAFDAAVALATCSEADREEALGHAQSLARTEAEQALVRDLR